MFRIFDSSWVSVTARWFLLQSMFKSLLAPLQRSLAIARSSPLFSLSTGPFSTHVGARSSFLNGTRSSFLGTPVNSFPSAVWSSSLLVSQTRGMKVKSAVKKRCEHCYIRRKNKKWYVYCTAHPRHKQRQR
jgi:large subunit ribosomal protein L36